jgi:hypothetical protein
MGETTDHFLATIKHNCHAGFDGLKTFIHKYPTYIILGIFLLVILVVCLQPDSSTGKDRYMNKSSAGFYYETDNMSFHSPSDRSIAVNHLIDTLATSVGVKYTSNQFDTIAASFIISMIEADNDNEFTAMASKLAILVDPTYKVVLTTVAIASKAGYKLQGPNDRTLVFDLLVKYFNARGTSISTPLSDWSDMLLIRTFKTLQLPLKSDFSKYPNVAIPDSVSFIPPGVVTSMPAAPISISSV